MVLNVVDDGCGHDDAALDPAQFAQWVLPQVLASAASPSPRVVRSASGIAAAAATAGVKVVELVSAILCHGRMLARVPGWRKADERAWGVLLDRDLEGQESRLQLFRVW
jgi:hypothetical protein